MCVLVTPAADCRSCKNCKTEINIWAYVFEIISLVLKTGTISVPLPWLGIDSLHSSPTNLLFADHFLWRCITVMTPGMSPTISLCQDVKAWAPALWLSLTTWWGTWWQRIGKPSVVSQGNGQAQVRMFFFSLSIFHILFYQIQQIFE